MIIYLPLQARLNHMLDYSLPCHMLEIATEIYNNNGPVKFTQHGCAILSSSPFLLWVAGDVLQDIRHFVFWPQIFHTDGVHVNLIRFKPGTLICWQDKNITLQIYIISMEFLRPKPWKSLSKTSPVAGSNERCIYNASYRRHKLITSIICSSRFFVSWMVYGNVWLTMYWSCSTFIVDSTISLTISTTNSSPSSCSTIWCLEIHKMER